MKLQVIMTSVFVTFSMIFAEAPFTTTNGTGTRAMGMANSYTAIANDYSATFWNPAGLAFLPIREVHIGIGGSKLSGETMFDGKKTEYAKSQMELTSIGLVRALPTTKGGFAFALGYSKPYSLNDIRKFSGSDVYYDRDSMELIPGVDTLHFGDTLYYDLFRYYTSGDLGLWSAAVGWQVAEGLGFGVTLSYLHGTQRSHKSILSHTSKGLFDDGTEISSETKYNGYDLRIGGLYRFNSNVSIGALIEIPKVIYYEDEKRDGSFRYTYSGKLVSSLSGAVGAAATLPFATVSADVNFRSPNPDVDEGVLSHWKAGGGIGIEVPLQPTNIILRGGYRYQELDFNPYAEYEDDELVSDPILIGDKDNVQMFTAGLTFVLSKSITFDAAYSFSNYSIVTIDQNWKNDIAESYDRHRAAATISIRY